MSTELEDRLQAEMRHATAGARVPPGLARRAWRNRRRRITTRAAAAAGTAAVVAAAAVAGTAGASRGTGIHTTAYVVRHVGSALSEAVAANDIMYLRADDGSGETWISSGPAGVASRTEMFYPPGQRDWDIGTNLTTDTVTGVNYSTKAWGRSKRPGPPRPYPPPTSCGQVGQPALPVLVMRFTPATLAGGIREALACGQVSNEGTQYVDGVDAIKLVSVLSVHLPAVSLPSVHLPARTYSIITTLWVDPASYLPLRWMQSLSMNGTKPTGHSVVDDIQWLPPTSANLAQLTVPIPAGFTRTLPGVPMPAVPSFS
ncbi:MAG TPA: hypothetical protein VIY52_23755 [Streptosporangiaceae bacterium]